MPVVGDGLERAQQATPLRLWVRWFQMPVVGDDLKRAQQATPLRFWMLRFQILVVGAGLDPPAGLVPWMAQIKNRQERFLTTQRVGP